MILVFLFNLDILLTILNQLVKLSSMFLQLRFIVFYTEVLFLLFAFFRGGVWILRLL